MDSSKTMAHYIADAKLMVEFEKSDGSGDAFNYSKSVSNPSILNTEEQMAAYLSRMQRGGLVQSFGCLLAVEEPPSFRIIGYSENCFGMLGLENLNESNELKKGLIGFDARTLFTPASGASLAKAVASKELSFLNPIRVHSRTSQKAFYAILHRIDVGIVIDLEPSHSADPASLHAGALQSQKLAVRAISALQSLPGGDIGVLCDTVVENVQKLTGYDRVMVYKFHDDGHGEVLSEVRRSDLEPYFGIHYPATDIPQAARFLFKQNRVRMICDCGAQPVKIIQSEELKQPLCLVNSTLRAPHSCHYQYMSNMGSISSLVMAVLVNNGDSMRLWGLVVCHHTSSRYVSFPLRYACEFLMQTFGIQLYMELQLAAQMEEKKILRMQTLLCDMLLRDEPFSIVTQSPNIMDLVKCDGAAFYHDGRWWLIGVTPTEAQMKEIVEWLLDAHGDSTGLSTDSLADAGFPGAALLGDAVCGMAASRVNSTDFLFWFRSHSENEIKWGGAKHHPQDKDDDGKMHPRSSFNAFLEVVKSRCLPWEESEINAIHALQLIMRDSFQAVEERASKLTTYSEQSDDSSQENQISSVAVEMVRLIQTAPAPIFGVDSSGFINGWNAKMCDLTGLKASEALGKSLINDIVHEDSRQVVEDLMQRALRGVEDKNVEVKLLNFGTYMPNSIIYLLVNACTSRNHRNCAIGVCFAAQDVTAEKNLRDKYIRLQGDYKAIIHSLNPFIPPIFASDGNACCCEWNAAMEKLTGWMRNEIIGKMLPGEVFGSLCQRKASQDALTKFMIVLYKAMSGHDTEKLPFGFLNRKGEPVKVFLTSNKRADESGNINGCFFFLQTVAIGQPQFKVDKQEEDLSRIKKLAYIRQEMKSPLSGIRFGHQLLERSATMSDQKQLLETSDACERQILCIIDDAHLECLEDGSKVKLKMEEFLLGDLVNTIICQAVILIKERDLQFTHDIPEQIKTLSLYGDQIKLQLVLSDFLLSVVEHASSPDGWVAIDISPTLKPIQDGNEFVQIQFRMAHAGKGIPAAVTGDMFATENNLKTQQGIALNFSQKLLSQMNGSVRYSREAKECYFLVEIEFKLKK